MSTLSTCVHKCPRSVLDILTCNASRVTHRYAIRKVRFTLRPTVELDSWWASLFLLARPVKRTFLASVERPICAQALPSCGTAHPVRPGKTTAPRGRFLGLTASSSPSKEVMIPQGMSRSHRASEPVRGRAGWSILRSCMTQASERGNFDMQKPSNGFSVPATNPPTEQ